MAHSQATSQEATGRSSGSGVALQQRRRLVQPAPLQQQGGLAQVDPDGVDPALERDQLLAAGAPDGGQGRLQVALDDGDLAAVHGPAGRLGPAAGAFARLPHPPQDLVAALRRPDVDLVDQQVVQGPVEHVAEAVPLLTRADTRTAGLPTASAMASALSAHSTASSVRSFSMWASATRAWARARVSLWPRGSATRRAAQTVRHWSWNSRASQ
jgi:hypothetical protein